VRLCSASELAAAISKAVRTGGKELWRHHRGAHLVVPGCRLQWFFGERVCDLAQAVGGIDLNGDSLMRHLLMSVRSLAIGNLVDGTTRHMGKMAYMCECDNSFDDGHLKQVSWTGEGQSPLEIGSAVQTHWQVLILKRSESFGRLTVQSGEAWTTFRNSKAAI